MSEQIRLEAVVSTVVVADLGITLRLNEVVWVTRERMATSECLRVLVNLGQVRVSSGARSRVSKEPPKRRLPTSVTRSRPNGRSAAPPRNEAPAQNGLTLQEAQAMADRAAKGAADNAVAAVSEQFRTILEGMATPSTAGMAEAIERAVSQALAGSSISKDTRAANAPTSEIEDLIAGGPEEPLFIPSGIVRESSENLSLQSDSSRGLGIDSASDALKALRKNTSTKS